MTEAPGIQTLCLWTNAKKGVGHLQVSDLHKSIPSSLLQQQQQQKLI